MRNAVGKKSSKPEPSVSVVIPHKGARETLDRCLESVRNQSLDSSEYEVIVVINEVWSAGAHYEHAGSDQVLWCEDNFSYAARNMGLSQSRGKIIAFIDSDATAGPQWLSEGVRHIQRGSDMIAGEVELSFEKRPLTPAACYEKLYAFDQKKNVAAGRAATVNLFVRRDTLDSCGPFNEQAASGEDFRWTSAATQAGHTLTFASTALVTHPARETLHELRLKARRVSDGFFSGVSRDAPFPWSKLWATAVTTLVPSAGRRASASVREKVLAHVVLAAVLSTKMSFVVQALFSRDNGSRKGLRG